MSKFNKPKTLNAKEIMLKVVSKDESLQLWVTYQNEYSIIVSGFVFISCLMCSSRIVNRWPYVQLWYH
jgi:hypothetical protein